VGVDASRNMVRQAQQTLAALPGAVIPCRIEEFAAEPASVDLVVSRLALHYVDDLAPVLRMARQALVPGGRLVFTVEHPVITACDRAWQGRGRRTDWLVDDYFVTGRRETDWLGGRVVKFHRTIEDYVRHVQVSGFRLETLREPAPVAHRFTSHAEFQRRQRIPLFLLLAAVAAV
jgi:SAM-dependent methyltransferase